MKTLLGVVLLAFASPAIAQSMPAGDHAHHAAMEHSEHTVNEQTEVSSGCTAEHAAMGHCSMDTKQESHKDCGEDAECTMDCCKDECDTGCCEDGECEMDCCDDGKDCCADMKKADHQGH